MKSVRSVTVLCFLILCMQSIIVAMPMSSQTMNSPSLPAFMNTALPAFATPSMAASLPDQQKLDPFSLPIENQPDKTPDNSPKNDTINTEDYDIEQIGTHGNWVKKKYWLLRSYEENEQIQTLATQAQTARPLFNERYAAIQKKVSEFFLKIGLEQGKLDELFTNIKLFLERKEREAINALNYDHERALAQKTSVTIVKAQLNDQRKRLEQLKLDIKSTSELAKSLSDRIKKMEDSLEQCAQLAQQAEKKLPILWHILDDLKARAIYYELSGNYKAQVSGINTYVNTTLLNDFDTVIKTIEKQFTKIEGAIKNLEKEEIIISNHAERVALLKEKKRAQSAPNKKQSQHSWLHWLYQTLIQPIARLANALYTTITNYLDQYRTRPHQQKTPKNAVPTPNEQAPELNKNQQ